MVIVLVSGYEFIKRGFQVIRSIYEACGVERDDSGHLRAAVDANTMRRLHAVFHVLGAEVSAFTRAEKITAWVGPVYAAGFPGGDDGYYGDAGVLLDACVGGDVAPPTYCWATKPTPIWVDAEEVIEGLCENLHEGATEMLVEHADELQGLLDGWCERHDPGCFEVDYSRAVLLSPGSES